MKYIEHAAEGLRNLTFSKLRSVLALLGVLVGSASVVAMVLGGELATHEALKQFQSLGTDLLAVSINMTMDENQQAAGKADNLSLRDAVNIVQANKQIVQVAPYTQIYYPMFYQGTPINGAILGVTDNFAKIANVKLTSGRLISLVDQYEYYCVIGQNIYQAIKKKTFTNPIGQQLQVGKNIFVIVGIAAPWPENGFIYTNIDDSILVPLKATFAVSKYATISNILMRLTPQADITNVVNDSRTYLNSVLSGKTFSFRSAKELIAKMQNQSDILTIFLGLIGSISLIVGGIGVMNIMLVSVMERRREIGIRLAVGATRTDIAALFLMEAVMLSVVGGLLGVGIGILIAYIIAMFWGWEFTFFLWPPVAGFSVSVLVGVFFGFYPAYMASKLTPIEALRSE